MHTIDRVFFHLMISHAFVISLRWCAEAVGGLCLKFAISKIHQNHSPHFNGEPCLPCTVVSTFSGCGL